MLLKFFRILSQISIIFLITALGNKIQSVLHIPIVGSIVGLATFFLLLQFKVIPERWVQEGANILLGTMVLFFIPSIVGGMNIIEQINLNYLIFIALIILGTCIVALASGYLAEKMVQWTPNEKHDSP
ncbi:CidA/LrgA family protein [Virgibacillus halodenitrificans]|uniref:CidA/LrgA family protein n=1 Tax=Virgibacillus halodenitrificans TaxID=1482 RepID=A0AAC9IX72_VIRHA|nr:CidA/LrgA family protein [Virgibacillus halodenitrificans]APC46860.1 CidA/LrgA family protein [Virgibacillus halodenitrificans]MCG1029542.1 CidA/LrgA family protein [Virgibacillus halodenitrificans]